MIIEVVGKAECIAHLVTRAGASVQLLRPTYPPPD
ncbi:hypothetical protein HRbin36_01397 [bacterium HR36]|nr:hypothetical protein HRbin36_01397 [bacterium HR36]